MSIRMKSWVPGDLLASADINSLAENGVVQVDTVAELSTLYSVWTNVNVAFCLEDMTMYVRGETEFYSLVSEASPATFNEASGTVGTYFDKTVDGTDYRTVEFLDDGTFVLDKAGVVDWWLGSAGRNGTASGAGAIIGAGGGHGAVWEMYDYYLPAGTYNVSIGKPGASSGNAGGPTVITPPVLIGGLIDAFVCKGGSTSNTNYPFELATTNGGLSLDSAYQPAYSKGTPGSGYNGGGAGLGADNASNRYGGDPKLITGWAEVDFNYGQGGNSDYGYHTVVANSGDGGGGNQNASFQQSGSGRAYIRVKA
jgi:hypothetical protein